MSFKHVYVLVVHAYLHIENALYYLFRKGLAGRNDFVRSNVSDGHPTNYLFYYEE